MDTSSLLDSYCSKLLEDEQDSSKKSKNFTFDSKLKRQKNKSKNIKNTNEIKSKESKFKNSKKTKDSFKIRTDVSPDDSDLSDAFENDFDGSFQNKSENDLQKLSNKKNETININNYKQTTLKKNQITEDGFNIRSDIPPDDSDISDAFESDHDEASDNSLSKPKNTENDDINNVVDSGSTKPQITEDGFKIRFEIPSDDSDLSDAFESDSDEVESFDDSNCSGDELENPDGDTGITIEEKPKLSQLKKPLQKLIEEFGMKDKFLNKENFKIPEKSKMLAEKSVTVVDYSQTRGKKKIIAPENKETLSSTNKVSKKEAEQELRKSKSEIYKFGMSAGKEAKKAKLELALKLGAKPLKEKGANYKTLIEERKQFRSQLQMKRDENREMGIPIAKGKKNRKSFKRRQVDTVDVNPKIGKFDGGVLKLSKSDLKNINSKKR